MKMVENGSDGITVLGICFSKEGEVIGKEEMKDFWVNIGYFNGVKCLNLIAFSSLHAQNEEIWGYRVSLPDAFQRVERLGFPAIYKYLNGAKGNAGHDKTCLSSRNG